MLIGLFQVITGQKVVFLFQSFLVITAVLFIPMFIGNHNDVPYIFLLKAMKSDIFYKITI